MHFCGNFSWDFSYYSPPFGGIPNQQWMVVMKFGPKSPPPPLLPGRFWARNSPPFDDNGSGSTTGAANGCATRFSVLNATGSTGEIAPALLKGLCMKPAINGLITPWEFAGNFVGGVTVAFGEAAIKMFMMEIASLSLISGLLVGANARISRKQGSLKSPTPHVMKCEWPSWWWSDCILAWLIKHPKNVHAISCWVREGAKLGTNLALGGGGKTKQNLPFH